MEEGEKKDSVVPDELQQGKDDISGVWSSKGVTTKTFFSPKVTRVNSLTETPLSLRHGLASIQGIVVFVGWWPFLLKCTHRKQENTRGRTSKCTRT